MNEDMQINFINNVLTKKGRLRNVNKSFIKMKIF